MPIVNMPDGTPVNFPDTMPPEQIKGLIAQKFPQAVQAIQQTPVTNSTDKLAGGLINKYTQGVAFGLGDEIQAGLSAGPGYLGRQAARGVNALVDMAGIDTPNTVYKSPSQIYNEELLAARDSMDYAVQQQPEAALAAELAGGLTTGFAGAGTKVGATVGNSLRTGNLATRVGKGAAYGAASGGLYGYNTGEGENRLDSAGQGALYGGIAGGAIPAVGAAVKGTANALTPKIDDGLKEVSQLARKYMIPVSLDQVAGSRALNNVQKVSQELPFSGQAKFRDKQMAAFNRELLKTVGVEGNKFTPEVMDKAFTQVGKEFDNLGRNKVFNLQKDFEPRIQEILDEAAQISGKDAIENFQNSVLKIRQNAGKNGEIPGEKLSKIRNEVSRLARKTGNEETRELLQDLENAIVDTMTTGDEEAAKAFSKTKQKYKNLLVIEPLAAKAKGGNISPALLQSRAAKIYGRQYSRGKAGAIGDLARIGNELLPEKGGSDTAQKLAYMTALGGSALATPVTTAPLALAGTMLGANRAFQTGINRNQALVNKVIQKGAGQPMLDKPYFSGGRLVGTVRPLGQGERQ